MSETPGITIGDRRIGPGAPCYLVAELSGNHGGDLGRALALVEAAAASGADAIKLQTYTADTITLDSDRPPFRIGGGTLWDGRLLHDLYREAQTPWNWQPRLKEAAEDLGLACFSSPFDATAIDFLEAMEVPAYKIASFELIDLPLIERVASTGKPLILSTGMATESEIEEAMTAARAAGAGGVVLLQCTSAYPAPVEEANLRSIPLLAERFGVAAGLSDHTLGIAVPVAAVALGACLIEKHLTLSRDEPGPDSAFSLEPREFAAMVEAVQTAERALGAARLAPTAHEDRSKIFRRSLFVVADVRRGERFTERNVRSIRPGHGLPPKHLRSVMGRHAARDIERGTPLAWNLIAPEGDPGAG
ncbi:MAG TPA: pseudaminic acid synthase [Thermoanaerobaculia bacterium]|nr:pseudaminic acid synthase [Thermoanaerobaculia bacterium]